MDLWQHVPPAWRDELMPIKNDIAEIADKLQARVGTERILPAPAQVFRALQVAPTHARVVIIGQDPYPNPRHACGLSFSVPSDISTLPGSLRNILTEVREDIGDTCITDGDLQPWVNQGVVLLNRVLTVAAGESNSHSKLGWEHITDFIIAAYAQKSPESIALLWGNSAAQVSHLFSDQNVITSPHPSPLSAYKGFFGSHPFSRCNDMLIKRQLNPIRW